MMSKWEPWGSILKVLEEAGERRVDPNPTEIFDIIKKSKVKRSVEQIKNELFRILKGMTSGEAQTAIVQGMTGDVFDVFRRFISKGKSRTKAAVRELRQKINMPRKVKDIGDYDAAAAEWDANVAKLISYRGQDTLLAQEDLLKAYYSLLPNEVMTFAQLKVDESFEPEGFREEMEKYIYRKIRESKGAPIPLANIVKEVQEKLQGAASQPEDGQPANEEEEFVQMLINLLKGKGKGKGKGKSRGKGPNGGEGTCFNCGEPGYYAADCPKPKKENNEKANGKGNGKKGKGLNQLADILKTVGLQVPSNDSAAPSAGRLSIIRPVCSITKWIHDKIDTCKPMPTAHPIPPDSDVPSGKARMLASSACPSPPGSDMPTDTAYCREFPELESCWKEPKRTVKMKKAKNADANRSRRMPLSVFLQMQNEDDEPNTDDEPNAESCSQPDPSADPFPPGSEKPTVRVKSTIGRSMNNDEQCICNSRKRVGAENNPFADIPVHQMHKYSVTCKYQHWMDGDRAHEDAHAPLNCLSTFQINNVRDEQSRTDIDDKLENLKVVSEQLRRSIAAIGNEAEDKKGWQRISMIVDSGACDIVADPRSLPGYPIQENEASRNGSAFLTAAGDPIPHLGEKEMVVCSGSGDIRTIRTQLSIVANPLLSVKKMIEAGQFVGFCEEGGFVLDTHTLEKFIG